MALKRVYSFDIAGGAVVDRMVISAASKQDVVLQPIGLTNWQLAILAVIARCTIATSSQIGRSLSMDRTTVVAAMKPLQSALAIETHTLTGRRGTGFGLSKQGAELFAKGLYLWCDANSATVCSDDNQICDQSGELDTRDLHAKKIA